MLIDSNIIIYSLQPDFAYLRQQIFSQTVSVSAISQLEVLGYHKLTDIDKKGFEKFFAGCDILNITPLIITKAIELRQDKKMSMGDAIIASTALCHQKTLVTRNVTDFEWIAELKVLNPIK